MRSRFKLLIAATLGLLFVSLAVPLPRASAALFDNSTKEACNGVALDSNTGGCSSSNKLSGVLRTALQLFSIVVGVIAVLMIIIGGVKFITSQGEAASVASARNTIIYAVVGLVIVAFAQIIVHFVIVRTKP